MSARIAIAALLSWLAASSGFPAQAQDESSVPLVVVLDVSGSMWGQVDGVNKVVFVREGLGNIIDQLPATVKIGLVAYGHRRKNDCEDIETIVPLDSLDRASLKRTVNSLNPKGVTPLVRATERALDLLQLRGTRATMILITDGIDTCGGDLVAVVRAARQERPELALYIAGIDIDDEDAQQFITAAAVGAGRYCGARTAAELTTCLDKHLGDRGPVFWSTPSTFRDEFDFSPFAGDHGLLILSTPWQEFGEHDGAGDGGQIEVEVDSTCFDGACLNVEADAGSEGVGAMRELDLSNADSSELRFVYGYNGSAGSTVVLEVSPDSGTSWNWLETYTLNGVVHGQRAHFDLTPYATSTTRIRFRVVIAQWGDFGVDDFELGLTSDGNLKSARDEFNAYASNHGSRIWSGPWIENDDGDPERGAVRLTTSPHCRAGHCLKLKPVSGAGVDIYRQADLTGATSATLTYSYEHLLAGDEIVAEVSADGGRTYTVLKTYDGDTPERATERFDLAAVIASETRIRFRVAKSGKGKGLWIDDLQIKFKPSTDPTQGSGLWRTK
jgi:hypothetical protein